MNLKELANLIDQKAPPLPFRRLVLDSRGIAPGDCFVALLGARFDGADYIDEAFAKGASCCISQRPHPKGLCVEDVTCALQKMAKKRLEGVDVYALTGAMGKTTTKHFVKTLMPNHFPITPANYNTQISLPLAVLNELGGSREIFLEMGMTEAGNLKRLVEIAPPKIAMVTYLPRQVEDYIHAMNFSSMEELIRAKYEIFDSPKLELALIPDDLPFPGGDVEVRTFSLVDPKASYALIGDRYYERGEHQLTLPSGYPSHHARNFLAGIAYARAIGATIEEVEERAPLFELPPMRFESRMASGVQIISDAYNASPEAMIAAFLALPPSGKRIAILGEMLTLGPHYGPKGHSRVLAEAKKHFDHILYYGAAWEGVERIQSLEELAQRALQLAEPGALIYVKGSRNLGLEAVVENLLGALA